MGQVIKKENITIVIREYQDQGQTKKVYRTIGELVTMQGDDGTPYQFGEMWGPTGSTKFKVFDQQDRNAAPAPQQGQQQYQQAPQQQQQQAPQQSYQQAQQGYPQR